MEEEMGIYEGEGKHMEGFCKHAGQKGYIPIKRE
jgi:hypothetical protein